jgi:hypothetical protein
MPAKPRLKYSDHSQKVSLVTHVWQRYIIKFFVEEGMKEMEITDRLNNHYDRHAIQRTQVCYWIKDVKSGRKVFETSRCLERHQMRGQMSVLGRRSKRVFIFQRERLHRP